MRQPNQDCYIQMKQNVTRAQQSGRGDYDFLGTDNNRQMFYDCYIFDDIFYSCLNAKVKENCFYEYENDDFCLKFIQELFTKIFESTTLFWKVNNEYPNTKIFSCYIFF